MPTPNRAPLRTTRWPKTCWLASARSSGCIPVFGQCTPRG